jgi:hypothetical protein
LKTQNTSLIPNCTCRGGPAAVIWPTLALYAANREEQRSENNAHTATMACASGVRLVRNGHGGRPLMRNTRRHALAVKFDGRVTAVSRVTLSADGRTMITTTTGRGARGQDVLTRTAYEKQ